MSKVELLGQFGRNSAQTEEMLYGDDVEGVVHVFATTTARDLIPGATWRNGELCVITADDSKWQWNGSTWGAYTGFGAGTVTAGNGLADTAGVFSVLPEDGTITVGASGVKRPAITGDATIAPGSNASVIANLAWSKLADSAANKVVTNFGAIVYKVVANGTVGATPTIDLTAGTDHTLTLAANTTLAFTNPANAGTRFRLTVTQDSTPRTLAFGSTAVWVGGQPRRLGTGPGEITEFTGEWNGTNHVMDGDIPSRLAPRGSSNLEVDLYAAIDVRGSLAASGGTLVANFPLVAGKYYTITWRIALGPASGQVLFFENSVSHAQLVSGAAVALKSADIAHQLTAAGISVAYTVSTTNVRATLTNGSGTDYKGTIQGGAVITDLPT